MLGYQSPKPKLAEKSTEPNQMKLVGLVSFLCVDGTMISPLSCARYVFGL